MPSSASNPRVATEYAGVKLSPSEQRVFNLLPDGGQPIETSALLKKVYPKGAPFNGRIILGGVIRSLERKTKKWPLSIGRVKRGDRRGPHPIIVRKEVRA